MRFLLWITLLALGLLALFAAANWTLLTAPAALNFLAFTVQGPLGLILLVATLIFIALFGVYALSLRTSAFVDMRRHARELEIQRELADKAEASRFTELRTQFDQESARSRTALEQTRGELMTRMDRLEQAVLKSLSESSNSLSAYVGEVDDKLDRLASR
jgi:biopolymer transport protein ExbB/TolQ